MVKKSLEIYPLISIILPTYNRASYLKRSINSVINQSYSNWELIVWDDGSTDNSRDVVFLFNDPRIRYFYDKNHGVSYARNRSIENSRGTYVAFLDSDDEWEPEKLKAQSEALYAYPKIDFLFSDFLNKNELRNQNYRNFQRYQPSFQLLEITPLDSKLSLINNGFLKSLAKSNYIATDTVILRKAILEESSNFNETLRNSVDFELWWRIGLTEVNIAFHSKIFMTRYKPIGSLSSPSVIASQNTLKALGLCKQNALEKGRIELAESLCDRYRNTWQNLILAYGLLGEKKKAVDAFFQSVKFGLRLGSVRLLLQALLSKQDG